MFLGFFWNFYKLKTEVNWYVPSLIVICALVLYLTVRRRKLASLTVDSPTSFSAIKLVSQNTFLRSPSF